MRNKLYTRWLDLNSERLLNGYYDRYEMKIDKTKTKEKEAEKKKKERRRKLKKVLNG